MDEKLSELLEKEENVKLAYLFGSAARGEMGKLSDVDVAVYLDESLPSEERFKLQLKLIGDVTSVLRTNKVDLVIMNEAPLLLNYNVIKHGKLIKCDERTKVMVETGILSKYLDMKYYIDRHAEISIKRMTERGLA